MRKLIWFGIYLCTFNASAFQSFTGKVTLVEPTYLPNSISFIMDTGNAACPKGRLLKWVKSPDNNKAVYSTLMAALMSGKKIRIHINDNDTSCKGQYLHLLAI